jgi:hypothetical protein
VEPVRTTFDRDLDPQPRQEPADQGEPIEQYQRLVANPFLTVLAWLIVFVMLREGVRRQNAGLFMTGIALIFVAFFLLQFHCLDCGATGWLLRSWAHACPAVDARRQNKVVRRWHGPGLKTQLAMWLVVIFAAHVLGMIALRSR